ncbi:hypothetical protein U91I_01671 [alpha proteobacterium U9-1i]|nr:hypothetical protein U91I_01671 [alpha proteobacterium U9-1i]
MSRDNVTPFRRPPRRPPPKPSGKLGLTTHRGKAVFVHILTLACFATPFVLGGQLGQMVGLALGVAAGFIAYSSRYDSMPWAMTHHEHALRTLIIAFVVRTIVSLPSLLISRDPPQGFMIQVLEVYGLISFWVGLIVLIWVVIRAGVGLVLAILRKPIWHPRGWLL